ncbi:MAG: SIMPL domain-containing protein [Pseudomonadota bacterium]|nr:SIMPL domain-containing protein [Pseudomonadota bacterium]
MQSKASLILGLCLLLGFTALGSFLYKASMYVKMTERSVSVKGLSEQIRMADQVIWPISFTVASADLNDLYVQLEGAANTVRDFLVKEGLNEDDISLAMPQVTDKMADRYNNQAVNGPRYTALHTVTVFSNDVEKVGGIMEKVSALGKMGIVLNANNYNQPVEYSFTGLNDLKPAMVEEATKNARAVAEKFAADSHSRVGKIKRASQGQFSISDRDRNNPHIKKIRVVSTVEYYLAD